MRDIIRMLRTQIEAARNSYNAKVEMLEHYENIVRDIKVELDNLVKQIDQNEEAIKRLQNG